MTGESTSGPVHAPWHSVGLEEFMATAEENVRSGLAGYAEIAALLDRIHRTLLRVSQVIEHDSREERVLARLLIVRTHASLLGAIRLALGGQLYEAYPLLRVAIEQAWYALHIGLDPAGTARARTWLAETTTPRVSRDVSMSLRFPESVKHTWPVNGNRVTFWPPSTIG